MKGGYRQPAKWDANYVRENARPPQGANKPGATTGEPIPYKPSPQRAAEIEAEQAKRIEKLRNGRST